ncbi:MAG TPA: hypothetical protein VGB94_02145 [Acidobacteriaceae bacterium]
MTPRQESLPVSARALQWLHWLQAAIAVSMVLAFVATAAKRLHLPFEYDWIEDGVLASVRHIRSGGALYQAPSVYFTPYLYTPIYLYTAALVSKFAGIGYAALRLLSIGATLGCFAAIYALVYSEVRRHFAALAAVGIFAACYPVVNACFDLGRVDMLYLFFVLISLLATRRGHPVLAAVLWTCAFQTKQGVLPIAVLALCCDWQRPRRVLLGLGAFAVLMTASIIGLTHATGGWYHYYVFGMAGGFGYDRTLALHFISSDMLAVCGIALLIIASSLLAAPPTLRSRALSFYVLGSVGMVFFTAYLRAHRGANVNSLLPAYAWIAVCFGVAMARLYGLLEERGTPLSRAAMVMILLAACVQMEQHLYSPNQFAITPPELAARQGFEAQLRAIPGEVLVLSHPEYGVMAGKKLYAGTESIGAVIEAKSQANGDALMRQYAELIDGGILSAVALDMSPEEFAKHPRVWMPADFTTRYPLQIPAIGREDVRFTSQPRWIYLPCSMRDVAERLNPKLDAQACAPR